MNEQRDDKVKLCPISMANEYLKMCVRERCLIYNSKDEDCLIHSVLLSLWRKTP